MGKMSRRKGRRAERHVTNWLNNNGFPHAEPRSTGMAGADVAELGPGLEIEIKDHKQLAFSQWIDQLERAMLDNGAEMGAVIVKRAGKTDVGDWFFVQPLWMAEELAKARLNECDVHQFDKPIPYTDIPGLMDMAVTNAETLGWWVVPGLVWPRRNHPERNNYVVTTARHGVRMLRAAGWGDPLETP